ncbi:hypothetical protein [Liquorilactobacillus ghanensis]|uniref:hypothetical protein n=1 Tax=Liquorilactobacillus ghanensis TaxID=399370 RepID=UPI0039E7718F
MLDETIGYSIYYMQEMAASYHYAIKKEATQKLANLLNQDFSTNEIGVICPTIMDLYSNDHWVLRWIQI